MLVYQRVDGCKEKSTGKQGFSHGFQKFLVSMDFFRESMVLAFAFVLAGQLSLICQCPPAASSPPARRGSISVNVRVKRFDGNDRSYRRPQPNMDMHMVCLKLGGIPKIHWFVLLFVHGPFAYMYMIVYVSIYLSIYEVREL